jgi:hypothetical protein
MPRRKPPAKKPPKGELVPALREAVGVLDEALAKLGRRAPRRRKAKRATPAGNRKP